jgi:hypothetical protein
MPVSSHHCHDRVPLQAETLEGASSLAPFLKIVLDNQTRETLLFYHAGFGPAIFRPGGFVMTWICRHFLTEAHGLNALG